MKPRLWVFGLLVIVIVGLTWVADRSGQPALAQQRVQQRDNGRFQIAGWVRMDGPRHRDVCYMVDTATGELWELVPHEGGEFRWEKKANGPR
jgi:hypothetical protein